MSHAGIAFDDFRDAYSMIADNLARCAPGHGCKVHLELIESMLDRWIAGKNIPKPDRVQRRMMRVHLVRILANALKCAYKATDDGNLDPDPDLYVEPSGIIFYRPTVRKPGPRPRGKLIVPGA